LGSAAGREAQPRGASDGRGQEPQSSPSRQKAKPSGDPQALFSKGQIALQNGDLDEAEKAFRQVIAIDPRAGGAYSNLGVIAMRRKDWDRALTLLEKAARLAPRVSGIRLNIGLVYYRQGNYVAAIPPLSAVLRDQPDSQQARYLLGLCNLFTQHYADAVFTLEPLWPEKSNDFMYLYVLNIAANSAGQKELDERALTRLIEVGGDSAGQGLSLSSGNGKGHRRVRACGDYKPESSVCALQPRDRIHADRG
jgi:tetratricopeptide (TPR) repeat protein